MDKAKAAISDFMGRSGQHDTTVHESVAPAVQHETVKSHQHENITKAVDKEIHQDHYHRTVQPVLDREVVPETHTAKLGQVEHREFDHRDHESTKRNLIQDQAQFKDKRHLEGTTTSQNIAPTVGGEHIHHHIHETIQPVVQKETLHSNVVHTTVPIHEVHHNKATHHDTTALPAMTMDQFKASGGALHGREERYDEFKGVPKNLGSGAAGGFGAVRDLDHKSGHQGGLTSNSTTSGTGHALPGTTGTTGTGGLTGSSTTAGLTGHHKDHHHTGHGVTGTSTTGALTGSSPSSLTGHHDNHHHTDRGVSGTSHTGGLTGSSTSGGLTGHDQKHIADRGTTGQGNLTGSSTQGGILSSDNRQDNNLASNRQDGIAHSDQHAPPTGHAAGVVEGVAVTGKNELTHRPDEDGTLPKALVEDKSKAIPHSELRHDDRNSTGRNNDTSNSNIGV